MSVVEHLKAYYGWEKPERLFEKQCEGTPPSLFYEHSLSLIDLLDPKPTEAGLNLGCGSGRVESQWAPRVGRLVGVDFSETMLAEARRRVLAENVSFVRNDGESIPLPDASFDFAWAELVFQHVPADVTRRYLRELARVLKPGGRFVCQVPNVEVYGDSVECGGMSEAELGAALAVAGFRSVAFFPPGPPERPADPNGRRFYHVPLART